jgi:hypothetical protein
MKLDFFMNVPFDQFMETVCDFLGGIHGIHKVRDGLRVLKSDNESYALRNFSDSYFVLNRKGESVLTGKFIPLVKD